MPAPQIGASPFFDVADEFRSILAQRITERRQAEIEAQKRQQLEFENSLKMRGMAVDEGQLELSRQPKPMAAKDPTLTWIRRPDGTQVRVEDAPGLENAPEPTKPSNTGQHILRGVRGPNGKPYTRVIGSDGQVITESEEYEDPTRGGEGARPRYQLQTMTGPDGKDVTVRVNLDSGTAEPVDTGGLSPRQTAKPPTGVERSFVDYHKRATQALADMDAVEGQVSDKDLYVIHNSPLPDIANNAMLSDAGKRYVQALRAYTLAKLRKESGAAISAGEFAKEALTAARNVGETPESMTQKKRMRQGVVDGFAMQAGKAFEEYYGKPANSAGASGEVRKFERGPDGRPRRVGGR